MATRWRRGRRALAPRLAAATMALPLGLAALAGSAFAADPQPSAAVAAPAPATGVGTEVPSLRTEFSRTRQLPGGVLETTLSPAPVNYRAGSEWERIDNRLQRSGDVLRTRANSVRVELPRSAAGEVRYADGADAIAFSLIGSDAAPAVVDGDTAEYADVGRDADLTYEVHGRTLKETLTLASREAPAAYRFAVDAGDLRPELRPSGDVAFVDADGRQQLGFEAPWMRDADGVVSRAARYELERSGGRDEVVLRLDRDWLADPRRAYPVIVDPTIYSGWEHTCEIRSGSRSNTNLCDGALSEVWVGRDANGVVHRKLVELRDLRTAMQDYAQVIDAWYAVYLSGQNPVGPSELDLHHLTTGFGPGVTWNRSDSRTLWARAGGVYDPQVLQRADTRYANPSDGRMAFDITTLTRDLIGGAQTSHNLLLKAADESRTHIDAFEDSEVKIRWLARTGIAPQWSFDSIALSDGSTLSQNVGNGNFVLQANDLGWEPVDGRSPTVRYFNTVNLHVGEFDGIFGRGSQGSIGSIRLEHHWLNDSYVFAGPSGYIGVFLRRAGGGFTSPEGFEATLTELTGGGFTLEWADTDELWTFNSDGDLTETRQADGYTVTTTWGPDGIATISDSAGHSATAGYDGSGHLRTLTTETSAVHRYDYDGTSRLTIYTAPSGAQTRYAYNGDDRLVRISLPDGRGLRIAYGGAGYPSAVTPVAANGSDLPATTYDGERDWVMAERPATPRTVWFYNPDTLIADLIQHGSDAAIATSGELPALDGGYVRGDAPLTVDVSAAQAPDGIQLTELEVDGVEVDSVGDAPCDDSSCPRRAVARLSYDPSFDAEGAHEFQVNTVDGDDDRTVAPLWTVTIDRTPPSSSGSALGALYYPDDATTELSWDAGADPPLPGASAGLPIASYLVRYRRAGGAWAELVTSSDSVELPGGVADEQLDVEITAFDPAGNAGPVYAASVRSTAFTEPVVDADTCQRHYGWGSKYCIADEEEEEESLSLLAERPPLYGVADETNNVDGIPGTGDQTLDYGWMDFQSFRDLRVKRVRQMIPWSIMYNQREIDDFDVFYRKARDRNREMMVSFQFGCRPTRAGCISGDERTRFPTQNEYTLAMYAFKVRFPLVRYISAWNEPNHHWQPTSARGTTEAEMSRGPKKAARYTMWAARMCHKIVRLRDRNGIAVPRCGVVAAELTATPATEYGRRGVYGWGAYMRDYKEELIRLFDVTPDAGPIPTAWAFHPYDDLQRYTAARGNPTRDNGAFSFAKMTPPGSRIWYPEVGSRLDKARRPTIGTAEQAAEVGYLTSTLATSLARPVARIYYYTQCAPYTWDPRIQDPGLLGSSAIAPENQETNKILCASQERRPAWYTFCRAAHASYEANGRDLDAFRDGEGRFTEIGADDACEPPRREPETP